MHWTPTAGELGYNVAFVSVGAMLVGSNRFTGAEKGKSYERGTEMGYFAYGVRMIILFGTWCILLIIPLHLPLAGLHRHCRHPTRSQDQVG